jgi:antitoxin component YwqK of YwqJK toxin-antitoxin module
MKSTLTTPDPARFRRFAAKNKGFVVASLGAPEALVSNPRASGSHEPSAIPMSLLHNRPSADCHPQTSPRKRRITQHKFMITTPQRFAFLIMAVSSLLAVTPLLAQETWEFEVIVDSIAFSEDGSVTIGSDTLPGSVDPNGYFSVAAVGAEFVVSANRDLLIGTSATPAEVPLRILTKRPSALTLSELAGQWRYLDFEIQPKSPGSSLFAIEAERLGVTLTSAGGLSIEEDPAGNVQIGGSQNVMIHVGDETLVFAINASKDLMVSLTEDEGEILLRLLVREDVGGRTADLQGDWNLARFSIDQNVPDMNFALESASFAVDAAGKANFGGEPISLSSSGDGTVTVTDGDETSSLIWSYSRNLLIVNELQDSEYALPIVIRRANALTAAELEGTWDLHELTVTSPNLNATVAEAFRADGTLAERYGFLPGNDGQRLRNGLSRTFEVDNGVITDTYWLADPERGVSVKNGEPAVQKRDAQGREILHEFWNAGVITQRLETTYNEFNPAFFSTRTFSTFAGGEKATEQRDAYHPGLAVLASRTSLVFSEGIETYRLFVNFKIDGVTRTDEFERSFAPDGAITEETTRFYLQDGVGLRNFNFVRYIDPVSPLLEIFTSFHEDGATVLQRTTQTAGEAGLTILTEQFYESGQEFYRGTTDEEGILMGTVTTWYANGNVASRINYLEGIQDGLTEQFNEAAQPTLVATYSFGQIVESTTTNYYPDGTPQFEQLIQNGTVQVIESRAWYENGQLHYQARTADSELDGLQRSFDELGNPTSEQNYVVGLLDGPSYEWHPETDQLASERNYTNGILDGQSRDWFADGQLSVLKNYVSGLLHGLAEFYNQAGDPLRIEEWVSDQLRSLDEWTYRSDGSLLSESTAYIRFGDLRDLPAEESVTTGYDEEGRVGFYEERAYGQVHGEVRSYREGVLVSRSRYKNDWRDGIEELYYNPIDSSDPLFGNLISRTMYVRGMRNGVSEEFDPANGLLTREIHYERDLRQGSYKEWVGGTLVHDYNYSYGQLDGLIREYRTDGTLQFKVNYVSGLQHGLWESFHENGTLHVQGNYDRDRMIGIWLIYRPDETLRERQVYVAGYKVGIQEGFDEEENIALRENYQAGVRHGLSESFADGVRYSSTVYNNGLEVGPRRMYYPDGSLSMNAPLVLGRLEGVVTRYFEVEQLNPPQPAGGGGDGDGGVFGTSNFALGRIQERTNYRAGLLHGVSEQFYQDGGLKSVLNFSAGVASGRYQAWSPNGQLTVSGSYSNGERCGIWRFYDHLGNLLEEENYGSCSDAGDPVFPLVRGVEGVVSLNGQPVPGARINISDEFGGSFQTVADGSFRYSLNQFNDTLTSFTVTVMAGPGWQEKAVNVTIPGENGFVPMTIALEASANTAPNISFLNGVFPVEETHDFISVPAVIELPFTISDAESSVDDLTVSFNLSNPALFESAELLGAGSIRYIRLITIPNTAGRSTLTITVSDGELSSEIFTELRFAHATVSRIMRGGASVLRDGQLQTLAVGDPIFEGELVVTDELGRIQTQTPDGSVLTIAPNTSVLIERVSDEAGIIRRIRTDLLNGQIRVEAVNDPDRELEVRTPNIAMGIRGTIFEVTVDEIDGLPRSRIVVEEGLVEVTEFESGNSSLLGAGESISITASPPFEYSYELTGPKSGRFDFATHAGYLYQLQYSTDLAFDPEALEVIDQVSGNGGNASLSFDFTLSSASRAFFRVVRVAQ